MTHPSIERRTHRQYRSRMQRHADRALTDHPYRLELVGRPGALDWPSICASCGNDTAERHVVRKVFRRPRTYARSRGGMRRQVIVSTSVPYCETCIARHRALVPPRNLLADAWHMLWPVLIPMAGAGFFFQLTLRLALAERSSEVDARFVWGLPALFGLILIWCVAIAWWSSRSLRVEKQTYVTRVPVTTATT